MSTIEEVRKAQDKINDVLAKLRKTGALDPDNLTEQLRRATEDYAKAVRELEEANATLLTVKQDQSS